MKNTVLIVDDAEKNLKLLEAFLMPEGYNILKALTGEECLEILGKGNVDIVLLDVMLPGKSGFEVCREIKSNGRTKFLPVVMVTALKEKEDRIKGIEAGADDFLTKPVDKHEMSARVKSLLRIKMLHDKLQKSYEDLGRLERIKEDLSRLVVHDMNNILTSISMSLELISRDENIIEPEALEELRFAQLGSRELMQMASNLIDISRMEENRLRLNMEKINAGELISKCAESLKYLAKIDGKQISQIIDCEGELSINADRNILERVIINLLTNALKYAPKEGTVTVKAGYSIPADHSGNPRIEISVSDQGQGIPPEFHEKIFDKYEQLGARKEGMRGGNGLGLYFCRMAVEAHGGRIWVESGSDKGSIFRFTLPGS